MMEPVISFLPISFFPFKISIKGALCARRIMQGRGSEDRNCFENDFVCSMAGVVLISTVDMSGPVFLLQSGLLYFQLFSQVVPWYQDS